MLSSKEVTRLLEREIGERWGQSNAHGVDLRRCLVPPEKRSYVDYHSGTSSDLWLVLEEDPVSRSGYMIVLDEASLVFGLATTHLDGPDIFLGPYGTFMDALENM